MITNKIARQACITSAESSLGPVDNMENKEKKLSEEIDKNVTISPISVPNLLDNVGDWSRICNPSVTGTLGGPNRKYYRIPTKRKGAEGY